MESWKDATPSEREYFLIIKIVFHKHPALLEFFFDKSSARMKLATCDMWQALGALSGGEQVLVRIAMDVWSGSGNAKLWRILEILDDENLYYVLKAIRALRRLPPI